MIEALIKEGGDPSLRTHRTYNKKKRLSFSDSLLIKEGGDILSHITAVPSAQLGLTSLFGKVRGEPQRNNHLSFKSKV